MGAFAVLLGSLHYMGLYIQLSASTSQGGHTEIENHISGNAVFTEVPRDVVAHRGQDVEMACSFRGAGTPSYSLEIQWWYIRNHRDWTDNQPWSTNEVVAGEGLPKDATKISVVKVAGSNISHKLRLSAVKPTDEGTYECRVIDFSDVAGARLHRARAYLQVLPQSHAHSNHLAPAAHRHGNSYKAPGDTDSGGGGGNVGGMVSTSAGNDGNQRYRGDHHQDHSRQPTHHAEGPAHHHAPAPAHDHDHTPTRDHDHVPSEQQREATRELARSGGEPGGPSDCRNEASCVP